jgi:porin
MALRYQSSVLKVDFVNTKRTGIMKAQVALVIAGSALLLFYGIAHGAQDQIPGVQQIAEGAGTLTDASLKVISDAATAAEDWFEKDILSHPGSFLSRTLLEPTGLTLGVGSTNIYQQNVHGGLSTHRRTGRASGSYDIELAGDLKRLLGVDGGIYIAAMGSWSKYGGIDAPAVGSFFGVNGDGVPREDMAIAQVWYEQAFFDKTLRIRVGKMDITSGFDCGGSTVAFDNNAYANDETAHFLNGALVNNPTIPFRDYGLALGAAAMYNPVEWWYVAYSFSDAHADYRESGFNTAFSDEADWFHIAETGVVTKLQSAHGPLPGAYRVGVWYDTQDKEIFDTGATRRDDMGYYFSGDQLIFKENDNAEDSQGLGVFGRYGWAESRVNDVTNFWSAGLSYQGLFEGRDDDTLGLGYARGFFSDVAGSGYTEDYEAVYELYYSAVIGKHFVLSPSIQYIVNTGGDRSIGDTFVIGGRLQVSF